MEFDYFYGEQSEQYAFYRIPKILIVDDFFQNLTANAKLLYGLLLDRVSLSASSGWFDEQGRVYIIYTIKSIQRDLNCGDKKAVRLLKELESFGLIEKVIQGQGKPALIYVKNFYGNTPKQRYKDSHNDNSGMVKTTIPELSKGQRNNTEFNNTEFSNTNLIISGDEDEREAYCAYFMEQLEIEYLKHDFPYETEMIDGILELILDTVSTKRKTIRISGEDMPANVVKSRFMKLTNSHIAYVMSCMSENTTKVRSIKQYLLAALYNAPVTISSYYRALVNNDMATGKI